MPDMPMSSESDMTTEAAQAGIADGPDPAVNELLATIRLVDHHTHSIVGGDVSATSYAFMLSESDRPAATELAGLDTQVGFAIRRWCAPLLGIPASLPAPAFLERRLGLSNQAAAALLLPAAGFERLVVETGYRGQELVTVDELGRLGQTLVSTVVRLETVAEQLALARPSAAGFADAFRTALDEAFAVGAVGTKSIVAYRFGLDFDPARPSEREVAERAGAWLREVEDSGRARLADPVLLRFVLWAGADTRRPLQIHTGYGDPDLHLQRADPLLMTDFLRATEDRCPVLLLHTYPFHRHAGYLAQVFPHVYLDVGLAVNFVGAQAPQVIAESFELAPFGKLLFSSDAWGLPELHLLGSWLFRRGMARVVGGWVARGDWSPADAELVIRSVAGENARLVYDF